MGNNGASGRLAIDVTDRKTPPVPGVSAAIRQAPPTIASLGAAIRAARADPDGGKVMLSLDEAEACARQFQAMADELDRESGRADAAEIRASGLADEVGHLRALIGRIEMEIARARQHSG